MISKLIIFLCLLIISMGSVSANNYALHELPDIESNEIFNYENNIYSTVKVLDDSDSIIRIQAILDDYNNTNNGLLINFSNEYSYTVLSKKFTYWGIPYKTVTHFMTYENYTIFNESEDYMNIIETSMTIDVEYDKNNRNTTFNIYPAITLSDGLFYETDRFGGLPTNITTFRGMDLFKLKITVQDMGKLDLIGEKKQSLSRLSRGIYTLITIGGTFESETILYILVLFDILFSFIYFIFLLIFVYPYLIIMWIIIIGNFKACHNAYSYNALYRNYETYYMSVFKLSSSVGKYLYTILIQFLIMLRNLIPFI